VILKLLLPLSASLVAAVLTAGMALGGGGEDRRGNDDYDRDSSYAIGLWGDLPYSDVQETVGVPNLVADMNR